jgi:hypothetical protein
MFACCVVRDPAGVLAAAVLPDEQSPDEVLVEAVALLVSVGPSAPNRLGHIRKERLRHLRLEHVGTERKGTRQRRQLAVAISPTVFGSDPRRTLD